jgi:putative peptidoglycan lipid II flippase
MILMGLGIGFWAQVVSYILIKSLNAQRKNKIVLIFMVIALVINSLFNVIFYKLLGSLTIGIGASIYGIVLFILLIKYFGIFNKISRNFIKLFIYSFLIGVSGFYLKKFDIYISIVFFLIYWGILVLLDKDIKEKILILRNRN